MQALNLLIDEIQANHRAEASSSFAEIERLKRLGMPEDLIYFYSKINGAYLHKSSSEYGYGVEGHFWKWQILPVSNIQSITESGWSHPDSPLHSRHSNWFQIIDVQNSDYLSIVLDADNVGEVVDTFHETLNMVGYNKIVAKSFTELISRLLSSPEAYWLKDETNYGYY